MIHASIILKTRLQVFGFISTAILLIIGAVCIFLDKNVESIATFILAIGAFCWTMFYGKKNNDDGTVESNNSE